MGYITPPADLSSASVSVTTTYTEANATETIDSTLVDFNIPAGKRQVIIKDISPLGGGDLLANPTVNEKPLFAGHPYEFEQFIDEVSKEVITSPALAVVTDGAYITYQYYD